MRNEEELSQFGFDLEAQKRAKRYHNDHLKLSLLEQIFSLAVLLIFTVYGSQVLATWADSLAPHPWLTNALYVGILLIVFTLLGLPFDWSGYQIELKYDLSNQSAQSWAMDQLKGTLISLVISLCLIPALFLALTSLQYWWLWAWLAGTGFTLFISFIAPTVLMPLFYDFTPLEDEQLAERLTQLAEQSGVEVIGTFKMGAEAKTEKAVGGLTGMGSTRRIILSDTLLDNFSEDEIETVIAHELGHHVHGDMWWGIARNSLMLLAGLFVTNLVLPALTGLFGLEMGIASLPCLAIIMGGLFTVLSPIDNTLSRIRERKADYFALDLTGKDDAAASTFIKLSKQNLSDAAPHPVVKLLFHDHPTALERVQAAKKFGK